MLQQIIVPSASNRTVILPETYYGRKVMVTVSALDEKAEHSERRLTKSKESLLAFFKSIQVDMTGFKFDREEANER